jgi:hypothetical protein
VGPVGANLIGGRLTVVDVLAVLRIRRSVVFVATSRERERQKGG